VLRTFSEPLAVSIPSSLGACLVPILVSPSFGSARILVRIVFCDSAKRYSVLGDLNTRCSGGPIRQQRYAYWLLFLVSVNPVPSVSARTLAPVHDTCRLGPVRSADQSRGSAAWDQSGQRTSPVIVPVRSAYQSSQRTSPGDPPPGTSPVSVPVQSADQSRGSAAWDQSSQRTSPVIVPVRR
jgi:hypothetical protein